MKIALIVSGIVVVLSLLGAARGKCSTTSWLLTHDTRWRIRRDKNGKIVTPNTLEWYCFRCDKDLGTSTDERSYKLLTRIRRQVGWARDRSRMVA